LLNSQNPKKESDSYDSFKCNEKKEKVREEKLFYHLNATLKELTYICQFRKERMDDIV